MIDSVKSVGNINFLNAEFEESKSEDEKSKESCDFKLSINFDKEKELLCLQATKSEDDTRSTKENLAILRDKASYYALYLRMLEEKRGYYHDKKTNEIIFIEGIDEQSYIVDIAYATDEENNQAKDIIDYHLSGYGDTFEIEESFDAIKKEYAADNTKLLLIGMGIITLVLMYVFYILLFEEDAAPPPPPPVVKPHLNTQQQNALKNFASRDTIAQIKELARDINSNEFTDDGKMRITVFKQGLTTVLAPESPLPRGNGTYYYQNPKLISGGLALEFDKTMQVTYPKTGYQFSSNGIYIKEEKERKEYYPNVVNVNQVPFLTKECIKDALNLSPKNTFVYSRNSNSIEFKFKDINASGFVNKAGELLEKCPAYFENVMVIKGTFQGSLFMFAKDRG